jgi:predicted nucleic acid-binding protein
MSLADRLKEVHQVFLDTAPVIYFVEKNPSYATQLKPIFKRLDDGNLTAVVSPITLAECLVLPYKTGTAKVAQVFIDLMVDGQSVRFFPIDAPTAEKAAELRAKYNISLADAFQIAIAIQAGCDSFLTNDNDLKRVMDIPILILSEYK